MPKAIQIPTFTSEQMKKYLSNFDQSSTVECKDWQGPLNPDGYGMFSGANKSRYGAHRLAYHFFVGPIPEGMLVDHTCHNRKCVNALHLRLVTHKQNMENRQGAQTNSKSGVRGVFWDPRRSNWRGRVQHNNRNHYTASHSSIEAASEAVRLLRISLFTHNVLDRKV